jgi:hypothetical protein
MPAFTSDRELADYLRRIDEERTREERRIQEELRRQRAEAERCRATTRVRRGRVRGATQAVIRGRVTNHADTAVPGARVSATPLGGVAATDANGRYRFAIPADSLAERRSLTVRAQLVGHGSIEYGLSVSRGDSIELDLELCPAVLAAEAATVTIGAAASPSITNVQEAGVDEGGIVKRHGDHLVILRRGRLFTVAVGDGQPRPVAAVDAFGPDVEPRHAWYDELLVAGDKVVVVGYSYERGGTELGVFRIAPSGALEYLETYQLRSDDYYSSRNYASRLIGTKLVFYAPLYLPRRTDPLTALPALRRWTRDGRGGEFERIVSAQRVYVAAGIGQLADAALHTVTTCDLAIEPLACDATVVVGPAGRVSYVSRTAVYVWMREWRWFRRASIRTALLSRIPLDGSPPSALQVTGMPVDQFSFLEDDGDRLHVLVRSGGRGEAMWAPEVTAGTTALLTIPLTAFGDGRQAARDGWYRRLPSASGSTLHNRFVNGHLLYGSGSGWWYPTGAPSTLYVVPVDGGDVTPIALPHGVDRIEAMGSAAVVVGADSTDLHLRGIRLGPRPTVVQQFTVPHASQGELRSHGFFYREDAPDAGVLGLPIRGEARPGYAHLLHESAAVLFLRNRDERFDALGTLDAQPDDDAEDGCRASCVDWYGNTRPLFIGRRVFALLGYELVEGIVRAGAITELSRISFQPTR